MDALHTITATEAYEVTILGILGRLKARSVSEFHAVKALSAFITSAAPDAFDDIGHVLMVHVQRILAQFVSGQLEMTAAARDLVAIVVAAVRNDGDRAMT